MRTIAHYTILAVVMLLLFAANIIFGAIDIPISDIISILCGGEAEKESWKFIILESRTPQALTALLSGAALATSGLMLQTAFRNPLADPSIFGISSGAGLGVALVVLLFGGSIMTGTYSITGFAAIFGSAFLGAMGVMLLIFILSSIIRNSVMLLIAGIMIGYIASSAISLLNFFATEEGVKSYLVWGLGNFGGVSLSQMPLFAIVCLAGLAGAVMLIKPLNIMMLGDRYAQNLGINIIAVRNWLVIITGLLTAIVTAYCGPISFIGLAVPHIARLTAKTDNHMMLIPTTIIMGSIVALTCNLLCILPANGIIPINAVTPIIGAPVIIYLIIKGGVK